MAWIESHDNLSRHPKTRRAARMLGISIPAMMGHLHLLWHWCLEYAENGDLSAFDDQDIADAMMWEGDPATLIDVLVNCGPAGKHGFLEQGPNGLIVHDWDDYAGRLIESRRELREAGSKGNHERWHVQRGIVEPSCPFCREESPDKIGAPSPPESPPDSPPESRTDRVLSHSNSNSNQYPTYSAAGSARAREGDPGQGDTAEDPLSLHVATLVALYNELNPVSGTKAVALTRRRHEEISAALKAGCSYEVVERLIRENAAAGLAPWDLRKLACKECGIGIRASPSRDAPKRRRESAAERYLREQGVI